MPDQTIIGYQNKSGIVASCPQPGDLQKITSATRRCSRRVAAHARAAKLLLHHNCPNGGRSAATPNAVRRSSCDRLDRRASFNPTASKGTTMAIKDKVRSDKISDSAQIDPRLGPDPKPTRDKVTAEVTYIPGAGDPHRVTWGGLEVQAHLPTTLPPTTR